MKLGTSIILSFMDDFSGVCNAVQECFTHGRTSFKIGVSPLRSCHCFINKFMQYPKCFAVISPVFTASFLGVEFTSRNHFLCSSIRSNSSSFNFYPERAAIHSRFQVPHLDSSLVNSSTSAVPSFTEALSPQCHPGQLEQTPLPNSYYCCPFDLFP